MLHRIGTNWRRWWIDKGFQEWLYHNICVWKETCCIIGTKCWGACEKEYPFMWELWREIFCDLNLPRLLGHTCKGWLGLLLSLCKTSWDLVGEWKGFMFQGYELKVIKCHNPTSELKKKKLEWVEEKAIGVSWRERS